MGEIEFASTPQINDWLAHYKLYSYLDIAIGHCPATEWVKDRLQTPEKIFQRYLSSLSFNYLVITWYSRVLKNNFKSLYFSLHAESMYRMSGASSLASSSMTLHFELPTDQSSPLKPPSDKEGNIPKPTTAPTPAPRGATSQGIEMGNIEGAEDLPYSKWSLYHSIYMCVLL